MCVSLASHVSDSILLRVSNEVVSDRCAADQNSVLSSARNDADASDLREPVDGPE